MIRRRKDTETEPIYVISQNPNNRALGRFRTGVTHNSFPYQRACYLRVAGRKIRRTKMAHSTVDFVPGNNPRQPDLYAKIIVYHRARDKRGT